MTAPVVGRGKGDDGQAERGKADVGQHLHVAAATASAAATPVHLLETEIFAVDPAALALPVDVAPGLILKATLDLQRGAVRNDAHAGEFRIRTGPYVDVRRGEARRSVSRPDAAEGKSCGDKAGKFQHLHGSHSQPTQRVDAFSLDSPRWRFMYQGTARLRR